VDFFKKKDKSNILNVTDDSDIGKPFDFKHEMKITVDSETGKLKGVPKEWEKIIKVAGLTIEEIEQETSLINTGIEFIEGKNNKQTKTSGNKTDKDKKKKRG